MQAHCKRDQGTSLGWSILEQERVWLRQILQMVISAPGKGWHRNWREHAKVGNPGSFSDRTGEISFEMSSVSLQYKLFFSCSWLQLGVRKDPFTYVFLYLVWRKGDFKLATTMSHLRLCTVNYTAELRWPRVTTKLPRASAQPSTQSQDKRPWISGSRDFKKTGNLYGYTELTAALFAFSL